MWEFPKIGDPKTHIVGSLLQGSQNKVPLIFGNSHVGGLIRHDLADPYTEYMVKSKSSSYSCSSKWHPAREIPAHPARATSLPAR